MVAAGAHCVGLLVPMVAAGALAVTAGCIDEPHAPGSLPRARAWINDRAPAQS